VKKVQIDIRDKYRQAAVPTVYDAESGTQETILSTVVEMHTTGALESAIRSRFFSKIAEEEALPPKKMTPARIVARENPELMCRTFAWDEDDGEWTAQPPAFMAEQAGHGSQQTAPGAEGRRYTARFEAAALNQFLDQHAENGVAAKWSTKQYGDSRGRDNGFQSSEHAEGSYWLDLFCTLLSAQGATVTDISGGYRYRNWVDVEDRCC